MTTMSSGMIKHTWTFRARFRRHAFGWRSQPAIKRIKEGVLEIKKVYRKNPLLGAEGAVLLLEKVSPAIEQVDSSSGAIGTAVNNAIDVLVPIIAKAPADDKLRDTWMEMLPEYWGELCVTPERASYWADAFIDTVRMAWSPNRELRGYFKGTSACLSALFTAGRNNEVMELLELAPRTFWHDRRWV